METSLLLVAWILSVVCFKCWINNRLAKELTRPQCSVLDLFSEIITPTVPGIITYMLASSYLEPVVVVVIACSVSHLFARSMMLSQLLDNIKACKPNEVNNDSTKPSSIRRS